MYINNEGKEVRDIEECISDIKFTCDILKREIKELEEENKKLKDSSFRDEEIKRLSSRILQLEEEADQSLSISGKSMAMFKRWQKTHLKQVEENKLSKISWNEVPFHSFSYKIEFHQNMKVISCECQCGQKIVAYEDEIE